MLGLCGWRGDGRDPEGRPKSEDGLSVLRRRVGAGAGSARRCSVWDLVGAYDFLTNDTLNEVRAKVDKIKAPNYGEFGDWPGFEMHLDELDRVAQEFENLGL